MTIQILLGAIVLVVFLWLMMPARNTTSSDVASPANDDQRQTGDSYAIGVASGLMGGSIEDAAIARYAINRTDGSGPADARTIATGTSMQLSMDDPT